MQLPFDLHDVSVLSVRLLEGVKERGTEGRWCVPELCFSAEMWPGVRLGKTARFPNLDVAAGCHVPWLLTFFLCRLEE